jgi:hypothetical protein
MAALGTRPTSVCVLGCLAVELAASLSKQFSVGLGVA